QSICTLRGCCWSPQSYVSVSWCFFSSGHGSKMDGSTRETQTGLGTVLTRLPLPSPFGNDANTVLLMGEHQTPNHFWFKV
ncbi:SUIS protein, partial [Turnix velox]|nr:SUIS protein [Turnix velox]